MTTTPPEPGTSGEIQSARLLEKFVVRNADLQRLEILLQEFNLFDALKLVRQEVRHSDFLSYFIDPRQNHRLSDKSLKAFLQAALERGVNSDATPVDIDVWNLTSAEVRREWNNIDIFVRDESNRLAVIIENKIESVEHSNQLARYYECVSQDCAGWKIIPIYLTVEREPPSDGRFIAMGYSDVCHAIEDVISLNRSIVDPDVRVVVEHYIDMLRRHLVAESEISELCRRIYSKHKEALDLIYEHRPDRQQMVRDFIENWIKANSAYELDHSTKSYIRFIPRVLDTGLLRQGSGWTPSGRILLLEAENTEDHLRVKVVIGPGPDETRRKLFEMAHAKKPIFKPFTKFYPQWNTIVAHNVLTAKDYDLHEEEFKTLLEQRWEHFIEKDLPPIVGAFAEQPWIRDGP